MRESKRETCGSSRGAYPTLWSERGDQVLLELLKRRYERGEITGERLKEVKRWMGVPDAGAANPTDHR